MKFIAGILDTNALTWFVSFCYLFNYLTELIFFLGPASSRGPGKDLQQSQSEGMQQMGMT